MSITSMCETSQDELSWKMLVNHILTEELKAAWARHQRDQERIQEILFRGEEK